MLENSTLRHHRDHHGEQIIMPSSLGANLIEGLIFLQTNIYFL